MKEAESKDFIIVEMDAAATWPGTAPEQQLVYMYRFSNGDFIVYQQFPAVEIECSQLLSRKFE